MAAHVPGVANSSADFASRNFCEDSAVVISQESYKDVCRVLDIKPEVGLFASIHNRKVKCYASWQPDPEASFIDALSIEWNDFNAIYVFPPFSLWGKVLNKLKLYKGAALIVYPDWKGQYWYPALQRLITEFRLYAGRIMP